jgi:hypothetical protein
MSVRLAYSAEPDPIPSWRSRWLFRRLQEAGNAFASAWARCWKDGKLVGELSFNGERYEWLLKKAADCHQTDELDRCAKLLDEAEVTIANGRGDLTIVLDFIDGLRRLVPCVHPAAQIAIDDTFYEMQAAFDDLAAVRKGAEYIRYRVIQELRWDLERLEKIEKLHSGFDLEIVHSRHRQEAFAKGYARLRRESFARLSP